MKFSRSNKRNIINNSLNIDPSEELNSSKSLGMGDNKGIFRKAMIERIIQKYNKNIEFKKQHGPVKHIRFDKDGNVIKEEVIDVSGDTGYKAIE